MITTDYPSPKQTIEILGGEFVVSANGLDELSVFAEEVTVNRMPLEVRSYVRRNSNGRWQALNIFAYRIIEGEVVRHTSCTDNQRFKLYRAIVEMAENLDATFLLNGQDAALGREIERLGETIEEKKIEILDLETKRKTLRTQYETSVLSK